MGSSLSVYLKASLETLWARLSYDPKELADRPLLAGDDGPEVLRRMLGSRREYYEAATISINTDNLEVADTVKAVVAQVKALREVK